MLRMFASSAATAGSNKCKHILSVMLANGENSAPIALMISSGNTNRSEKQAIA